MPGLIFNVRRFLFSFFTLILRNLARPNIWHDRIEAYQWNWLQYWKLDFDVTSWGNIWMDSSGIPYTTSSLFLGWSRSGCSFFMFMSLHYLHHRDSHNRKRTISIVLLPRCVQRLWWIQERECMVSAMVAWLSFNGFYVCSFLPFMDSIAEPFNQANACQRIGIRSGNVLTALGSTTCTCSAFRAFSL